MYQLEKTAFGAFEKYRIWNTKSGNSFSFVPGHGACLLDIQLGGQSVIEGFETATQVNANRWMKSAHLVPFPNRLKMGKYKWSGRSYRFFLNDPVTQNALHGFVMNKKMELTQKGMTEEHAIVSSAFDYDGSLESYPFPFTFEVTYLIKEPNSFKVTMNFQNNGEATIPVGMGWHPYFQINKLIDTLQLQLPPVDMIGIDEYMIPTGKRYDYTDFESAKRLGATVLDNCFALKHTDGQAEVFLKSETHSLRYWQETGAGKFNYLQVFTHPDRISLALEPMTCNIDAFNNGEGLISLEPGERVEASCGFELEQL